MPSTTVLEQALSALQAAGERGLTRHELADIMGVHERMARRALSALREQGVAAVVTLPSDGREPRRYRLARDVQEYRRYRAELISRIVHLARAVRGMDSAWRYHDPALEPLLERVINLGWRVASPGEEVEV